MFFFRATNLLFIFFLLINFSVIAEDISVDVDSDIESLISAAVADEDVLVFEPGTYQVNIELNKNIDLRARDTANTVLESLNGTDPVININGASNITIQNFTFRNNEFAIKIFDSNIGVNIDITNNVFQNNGIAIEVGDVSKITIENNTFFSNTQGVDGTVSEADIRVYQNIFHSNEVTFLNATNFDISYNCFNESVDNITEVNNNLRATISFVDQEGDDFHLTEDSGCIDKGEAEDDFDDTLSDLGAYGGVESDLVPNAVVMNPISISDVVDDGSITVSWDENLDYRIEGYKVYYSTNELKGLNDFSERENLSADDAEDKLTHTITGLDFNPVTPDAPAQLTVEPRDEKLFVTWNKSTDATSYTLYYQEQGGSEKSEALDDVASYTITGLSNDITYDIWLVAHYQKQYHFQVAAYLASNTESNFRESSFVLDDATVDVGEVANSVESDIVAARPEKIVAYPDLPNEGCFIATAAFGYYSAHEVQILRDFRDQHLLTSEFGTSFVHWYYKHGPKAASVINEYEFLKSIVRVALYPLIISVELINISFLLFVLILLALIAGAVLAFRSIANRNKVAL